MKIYETHRVGNHDVKLYQIKFITAKLGWTPMAVRQKEARGIIPPANFRSASGVRLYTVEEMAMFEYLFKELWPYRQGIKTPLWFKTLSKEVFILIRDVVMVNGRLESEDVFEEIQKKYGGYGFNKYRAWIYILSWRDIFEVENQKILRDLITEFED